MSPNGDGKDESSESPQIESREALDIHRQIVIWLFVATFIILVILSASLIYLDMTGRGPSCLIVVSFSGIIGGFVSALKRMYAFKDIFPKKDFCVWLKQANFYVICYSTIPPLIGAIAAIILYVIFASGMLTGDLFPEFHCARGQDMCNQFKDFVSDWQPETAKDYAKSIVWGFIAGFSERFVPDILNKFGDNSLK